MFLWTKLLICVLKYFSAGRKSTRGFSRDQFKRFLSLSVNDSFFLFNGTYYEQRNGVAMGSPLGPTLANIFLCYWEEIWIKKCPKQFRPVYYNRFMDDTFLLFSASDHVLKFHKYINSRHNNMTFTYETEKENKSAHLYIVNPLLVDYIRILKVLCLILIKRGSYLHFSIERLFFAVVGTNSIQFCFLKDIFRKN